MIKDLMHRSPNNLHRYSALKKGECNTPLLVWDPKSTVFSRNKEEEEKNSEVKKPDKPHLSQVTTGSINSVAHPDSMHPWYFMTTMAPLVLTPIKAHNLSLIMRKTTKFH